MAESPFKNLILWTIRRGFRPPHMKIGRVTELCFLKELLARLEVDCVLDIGANKGQFATELRGIGYTGLLLSFEPLAAEFRYISEQFKNDPNWRGFQYALGSAPETKSINVPALSVFTSMLESVDALRPSHTETITIRTLDEVLPDILPDYKDRRIFMKIDTQGYDLEVFKGAANVLGPVVGLQSEVSVHPLYKGMPHYLEALQVYEDRGFDLFNLSDVLRKPDNTLMEMNCFMLRRSEV